MNLKIDHDGRVVTVRLHRPEVRNALNTELLTELISTLRPLDRDPGVGCFVITGSDEVFAAGADIKGDGTEVVPRHVLRGFLCRLG